MTSVSVLAARFCGRIIPGNEPSISLPEPAPSPPWRRASRTKAALEVKALAVEAAVRMLEDASVVYTQPVPGKLVIHARATRGRTIIFWPAKERLRIGRRPTETQKDLRVLKQVLANEGHRIPGYIPCTEPSKPPRMSKAERLRAHQEIDLAEMEQAQAQMMESLLQMIQDLEAGRNIKRRDPRSARAKRLFKRAWARSF